MTFSIFCIKNIKAVNGNLDKIIRELQEREADDNDISSIKEDLAQGFKSLSELNSTISSLHQLQLPANKETECKKLQATYDNLLKTLND